MAAVEKQLEAAQRFLRGVRSLPSYEDIQTKQLKGLLHCLDKVKDLSTAQAGIFLDALDPELWSEEAREKLRLRVAEKTSYGEEEGGVRRPMQDFTQITHFLTEDLAAAILGGQASPDRLLRLLCSHAAKMTLRVPSEVTVAVLVMLANWQQINHGMDEKSKFLLLQQQKPLVRKLLLSFDDPPMGTMLQALPLQFALLPQSLLEAAFGNAMPADMGSSAVAMMQAARTIPLRMTNRHVTAATTRRSAEEGATDWAARMISAAVQGAVSGSRGLGSEGPTGSVTHPEPTRRPEMLALMNAPHNPEVAPAADLSTGHERQANAVDPQVGGDTAAPLRDSLGSVEAQLATLRAVAPKAQAKAKSKVQEKRKTICKRPAAKSLKRPAALKMGSSASTGHPTSNLKPKRLAKAKATSQAAREARRKAMLAAVPKAVQAQFKNGCSKCRYTRCTVSCWRARGFVST